MMENYSSMEFVHPDDRYEIYERAQRRFKGERIPSMYPYRIVCKNGSVKWVEVNTEVMNTPTSSMVRGTRF